MDPTGAWRVGRATVEVVDKTRRTPGLDESRRLVLRTWFPATPSAGSATLPYMEGLEAARGSLTNDEITLLRTVRTHSFEAPPAAPGPRRFPVLLFSHGEQMNAFLYSNFNEELASRGYIVIAVDHPGAALFVEYPDGSVVPYSEAGQNPRGRIVDRAADLRFVRDQIRTLVVNGQQLGDVVSGRVGAFGHSSGGIAAALLCQQPPVVDACVNLDGRLDAAPVMTGTEIPGPSKPFMYVTKPLRPLTDAELRAEGITRDQASRTQADTWARDGRLLASAGPPSYRATLHHAEHESFSDEPLLREPENQDRRELMRIVRDLVVEFFDTTIAGSRPKPVSSRNNDDIQVEVLVPQRAK